MNSALLLVRLIYSDPGRFDCDANAIPHESRSNRANNTNLSHTYYISEDHHAGFITIGAPLIPCNTTYKYIYTYIYIYIYIYVLKHMFATNVQTCTNVAPEPANYKTKWQRTKNIAWCALWLCFQWLWSNWQLVLPWATPTRLTGRLANLTNQTRLTGRPPTLRYNNYQTRHIKRKSKSGFAQETATRQHNNTANWQCKCHIRL